MNEFISNIRKDWDKAKQGFDRFMAKADGQDEYQNIKAAQKKARTELTQKILTQKPDQKTLEGWLADFEELCYQDGLSQGYLEGGLTGSETME